MFCIQAELLTGRFVATDYADRQEPEWPPHPARLFSALVASYAVEPEDDLRAALLWLEGLGAPTLYASPASARDVLTVFVPVNDLSVVGSFEDRAAELALAEEALAHPRTPNDKKALAAAEKSLAKARSALTEAMRKATAAPAKVADAEMATAEALLPDNRRKQPRTFPSVTPEDSRFALIWPEVALPAVHRDALDRLCARVHRLGHSSSLVSLHLPEHAPAPNWLPHEEGETTLRVVQSGQLARLEEGFLLHQETLPRVMPASAQRYRAVGASKEPTPVAQSVFSRDWVILKRVDGDRLPIRSALALATAVRGALLSHAPDARGELLSGHTAGGRPSERDHLAIVPLPFVGYAHADGELKGVALIFPDDASEQERQPVYAALGAWERACRKGPELATVEHPPLSVKMGGAGRMEVELAEDNLPTTLRSETWCRPATCWVSVTPVALDHNPGELGRRPDANPEIEAARIASVVARAEGSLRKAIQRIKLPEPLEIVLTLQSPIVGSRPRREFPGFKSGKQPRVLVHATIVFAERVAGPMMLGAGRYAGYGLFRPVEDEP